MNSEENSKKKISRPGTRAAAAALMQQSLFPHLNLAEIAHALSCPSEPCADDFGLGALLQSLSKPIPADMKALFMGPKAENAEMVEKLMLRVFRDNVHWRRDFHREDEPAISQEDKDRGEFHDFVTRFEEELFALLGELKSDIPFFSPRYIGHMTADLSLPALIGYMATMLYNPNNVSWEASPVTTLLEVEVGRELAWMLGFGKERDQLSRIWGHITSGGTLANIEAIWVAKALKFLPVALRFAACDLGIKGLPAAPGKKTLDAMTAWELVNLSPGEALDLKDAFLRAAVKANPGGDAEEAEDEALQRLKANDILTLGDYAFFSRLTGEDALGVPAMFIPQTKHYSWVKGPGCIAIGSGQVVDIRIDDRYRQDVGHLREELEKAAVERRPAVMVVGVLGTTEEGAVDPMHELVALRGEMAGRGIGFFLHCDAAYGGYMGSCFRKPDGELRSIAEMQREYGGWPSPHVYESYAAAGKSDSATVDPHKLGYLPYPAGAIILRDGRCKELVAQEASYALGGRGERKPGEFYIGKYILEGSKPGAAAAAAYLSHRVIPVNELGYGRLLGETTRIAKVFMERLGTFAGTVADEFTVIPLTDPDTNIVDYLFNLAGNERLDFMNRFSLALYSELSIDTELPVQTRRFVVSHTEFEHSAYNPEVVRRLLPRIGVRGEFFASKGTLRKCRKEGREGYDSEVVVFRTTLMNAFTLSKAQGSRDYIDLFLETLPVLLRTAKKRAMADG